MVIHKHEVDDKFKIRRFNFSTSHTTSQNINDDNNNQDVLSLNSQSQLRNCSSLHCLRNNRLRLYHPNIRGLQNKTDEWICSMCTRYPHIHCLTGRHIKDPELDCTFLKHYILTAKFCQQSLKSRGISIFFMKLFCIQVLI